MTRNWLGRSFLWWAVAWAASGSVASSIRPGHDGDFLGAALRARVQAQLPREARVEIGDITSLVAVPNDATVVLLSPNPPLGIISFSATWLKAGVFQSTHGTALVQAYAPVAITRAPLRPGDPLSSETILFEERELSPYAQSGYFLNLESLKHARVRGFARAGMVLGSANTELPLPVHQGEMVELVTNRGALRLVAQVLALQSGKVDQMIRVQNLSTKRVLLARVSGPGALELH